MFALISEAGYEQRTSHNVRTPLGALVKEGGSSGPPNDSHEDLQGFPTQLAGAPQGPPEKGPGPAKILLGLMSASNLVSKPMLTSLTSARSRNVSNLAENVKQGN